MMGCIINGFSPHCHDFAKITDISPFHMVNSFIRKLTDEPGGTSLQMSTRAGVVILSFSECAC
jgi:hypothetical protein